MNDEELEELDEIPYKVWEYKCRASLVGYMRELLKYPYSNYTISEEPDENGDYDITLEGYPGDYRSKIRRAKCLEATAKRNDPDIFYVTIEECNDCCFMGKLEQEHPGVICPIFEDPDENEDITDEW